MLPYAPIHHVLFHLGGFAMLVMTSGNLPGEPMLTANGAALQETSADAVLDHDRRIVARADDTVVREIAGTPVFIRRARGRAPEGIPVAFDATGAIGCGAMLKNTVALGAGRSIILSPHIGDLGSEAAYTALCGTARHLQDLLGVSPFLAVCDMHPDFLSTRFAASLEVPLHGVQHHLAHACGCMAENRLDAAVAVVYDGVGHGLDGSSWGGEIFVVQGGAFERARHLDPMPMAGGDACVAEPLRMAAGVLSARGIQLPGMEAVCEMLEKDVNVHYTCGMGRLFDAAAAIAGLCTRPSYEGQGPMMLEAAADGVRGAGAYAHEGMDPGVILEQLYRDRGDTRLRAARFHNTVVAMTVDAVREIAARTGLDTVCLSGGCFQNRRLCEGLVDALHQELQVCTHRQVPPNDGGIAFGQIAAAVHYLPSAAAC